MMKPGRKVIERFMQERVRNGLAVFGFEDTKKALESRQVSTLIVNEDAEVHRVVYKSSADGRTFERIEYGNQRESKDSAGNKLEVVSESDAIGELLDLADAGGVETVFVSSESSYGKEFAMGYKGIGLAFVILAFALKLLGFL